MAIKMSPQHQRLGNVIYWLGCILAIVALVPIPIIFLDINYGDVKERILFSLLFALIAAGIWVAGHACRYALTEK
jgi:hypothetical protein